MNQAPPLQPDSFATQVQQCAERLSELGVAALSGLFDLTSTRLVRLAVTITRNQHDAEDAVQSVLARVATAPRLLSRADEPWHYLLRMVRNESLMILRRRRRTLTLVGLTDLLTRTSVDQAEQEESFRAVWLALRRLPVRQSEVVVLKVWEGLTFAQIGDVLAVSPATATSRYRYALEKLSVLLAPQAPTDTSGENSARQPGAGNV
ncbi:MAG: sigma-70 family RNA polymerase sigma factor [Planctomycetales bacterium]|nr:sigma-70 family RNA polymerase sigma factor [Planctomycetales bacterium]